MAADNTYTNAMIFSLGHPYGTPTILSSYTFSTSDTDAGAPNGGMFMHLSDTTVYLRTNPQFHLLGTGTCYGAGGVNGWLCQHRWTGVAGMVGFHNNVGDAPLTNWVSPQSEQIAFERGWHGFQWNLNFSTELPSHRGSRLPCDQQCRF